MAGVAARSVNYEGVSWAWVHLQTEDHRADSRSVASAAATILGAGPYCSKPSAILPRYGMGRSSMRKPALLAALCLAGVVLSSGVQAQGLFRGAEEGAARGNRAAGPVGGIVGGAVGAGVGTVNGALGIGPRSYRHGRRYHRRYHRRYR
jgi:hypothetical protein